MYPSSFNGSTDPTNKSGTATFMVSGRKFELQMQSFDDYQAVCIMLELADTQGKQFATLTLHDVVQRSIKDKARAFDLYDLPSV
jgi:hypothetical protein